MSIMTVSTRITRHYLEKKSKAELAQMYLELCDLNAKLHQDAELLDALEAAVTNHGRILLWDGDGPFPLGVSLGLAFGKHIGLRTLRQALKVLPKKEAHGAD